FALPYGCLLADDGTAASATALEPAIAIANAHPSTRPTRMPIVSKRGFMTAPQRSLASTTVASHHKRREAASGQTCEAAYEISYVWVNNLHRSPFDTSGRTERLTPSCDRR